MAQSQLELPLQLHYYTGRQHHSLA